MSPSFSRLRSDPEVFQIVDDKSKEFPTIPMLTELRGIKGRATKFDMTGFQQGNWSSNDRENSLNTYSP